MGDFHSVALLHDRRRSYRIKPNASGDNRNIRQLAKLQTEKVLSRLFIE